MNEHHQTAIELQQSASEPARSAFDRWLDELREEVFERRQAAEAAARGGAA